jgi:hypothetical protein
VVATVPLLLVFTTTLARRAIDAPSPARPAPAAVAVLLAEGDSASLFLAGSAGGVMAPLVPQYEAVADPFRATAAPAPRAVAQVSRSSFADATRAPARERRPALSAILITDSRRAAVIDERLVGIGDVLADGTRVTAVERNFVIVTAGDGSRRRLTLPDAGGV